MEDIDFNSDLPSLSSDSSNSPTVTPDHFPPGLDFLTPVDESSPFNTTLIQSLELLNISPPSATSHTTHRSSSPPHLKSIEPYAHFHVPGIPNDFYSNVICWSHEGSFLLIAVGDAIYVWRKHISSRALAFSWDFYPDDAESLEIPISNLVISNKQLIAFSRSCYLCLFDIITNKLVGRFVHKRAITLVTFLPNTSNIFFGDEKGNIYRLDVEKFDKYYISQKGVLEVHSSQICGITITPDGHFLAAGENDNTFSIWDISNLDCPKLLHVRTHNAAIKALSFCPWSPILATGGGTNDRTIKFWHILSGILVDSYKTPGQITSLIWSKYSHKIIATFGFGSSDLLIVYSFPNCAPVAYIKKYNGHCRAISAVPISSNGTNICIESVQPIRKEDDSTFDDGYLQFCKVSKSKRESLPFYRQFGIELIDMVDGVDDLGEIIR